MAKYRKLIAHSAKPPQAAAAAKGQQPTPRVRGWRLWAFRLVALVAGPALCFGLLELVLRLVGFGYPTAFLLRASQNAERTWVQNNQFGWRFFGPKLSRLPWPLALTPAKEPKTVRIFVFGESAAKGEPQPAFGLSRMLQALLSERYPGVRFEVVNAAMTAINSHAVRLIARDCAQANGDIWVIYMGNNEVVGPFGAGTVFGSQTLPLPLIRSALALKSTRTGQWLDTALQAIQQPQGGPAAWGGMQMFLDQQVRADDPRLQSVYQNFATNLRDIIRTGRRHGVGIVVSTVAVNLLDSAPFASLHPPAQPAATQKKWEQFFQRGIQAQAAGQYEEAATQFEAAAQLDDRFADLRFRQGQGALALGRTQEAQEYFRAARDLDTLRFRCDSQLNDLIRRVATAREPDQVWLADAEQVFAAQSPNGLPGENLFYEHVHLNFAGNYLLAKTLGATIEKLLPAWVTAAQPINRPWPTERACAARLGWSELHQLEVFGDILTRLSSAPFTGQLNHEAQMLRLRAVLKTLAPAGEPARLREAQQVGEARAAAFPDDPVLHGQLATLQMRNGDLAGAAASARLALQRLPSDATLWFKLGMILAQARQYEEAAAAFQRALQLDPMDFMAVNNLAQSWWALGRREEAIREFRRMTTLKPNSSLAWLNLGQSLETLGQKVAAESCYHKALARPGENEIELVVLAQFCRSRGWLEAAGTNYHQAIELNPGDAKLRFEAGQNFLVLGRYAAAEQHLAEAVRLAPEAAEAHYFYGLAVAQAGRPVEAEQKFRAALRIQPDLAETRVNLGAALMNQGRGREALAEFETVLRQDPTNPLALEHRQTLRRQFAAPPAR